MTKNRRHDIVKPSKFKTSMCTFFMSAEGCPFGDKCAFAHGEEELRAETKRSSGAAAAAPDTANNHTSTAASAGVATSSPTSSHSSAPDDAAAQGDKKNSGSDKHSHSDPHNANNAKRKAKKTRMDVSTSSAVGAVAAGSTHSIPGGRSDATYARCRPQRERRTLPPPPPMQSHGPMPAAAYNLSVAPAPPAAYALYGDFNMAYAGMPAMSGMPYYIPTVGNHPFSNINNNHHAINVVPSMQSPMPYAAAAPPPPTFPVPLPQATPTPQNSMPSSPLPLHPPLNSNNSASVSAEDAKRRSRQAMRHVVSSNTMAHSRGRHTASGTSAPPAEVASPQYVYGLMAAAGVPLNGSPVPAAAAADVAPTNCVGPTPDQHRSSEVPSAAATSPQQQQPRLIVVPHKSGYGGFVVPNNIKNYHPQTTVEPMSSVLMGDDGNRALTTASQANAASRAATPPTASSGTNGVAAAIAEPAAASSAKATPAPPTVVHIPLSHGSGGGGGLVAGTTPGRTIGDALWGPAGGSVNPPPSSTVTGSTAPDAAESTAEDGSGGDYNALLSGLGIGGSAYTTIPLEELVRQRGAPRDDDDGGFSTDFDWTGALERWLHTAKEEEKATAPAVKEPAATAEASTATPTEPTAAAKTTATAGLLLQTDQPVTSALNYKPVLMEGETKPKATTTAAEGKRKPTVVCQVSRAGGKPAPPKRRAPVTTNQFKSSCVAEAESGSVLLYCADKNTLVYITSANDANGPTAAAAAAAAAAASGSPNTNASQTGSTPSNGESDGTAGTAEAAQTCEANPESPNTNGSNVDLGVDVRFNPGRKKQSVLDPVVSDDDAEYCI